MRTVALELERLDALHLKFYRQALSGDTAAGSLLVKISERRAALLALDSPIKVDIVELQREVLPKPTSTERLMAALDQIAGKQLPPPPDAN